MSYKELTRSGFAGCRLLHQQVDPYRNRPAKYFAIPGEFAYMGYSDDTDAFVIPISSYVPQPARDALQAIREGRAFTAAVAPTRRRFIADDNQPKRRAFHA